MDPIEAFAQSVVRDYLREKGFTETLECLTSEMQKKSVAAPSVESWYEVSHKLNLPELIRQNNSPAGKKYLSLMEVLVDYSANLSVQNRTQGLGVNVTVNDRVLGSQAQSNPNFSKTMSGMTESLKRGMKMGERPLLKDRRTRDRASKPVHKRGGNVRDMNATKAYIQLKGSSSLTTLGGSDTLSKQIVKKPPAGFQGDDANMDTGVRSTENWVPMEVRMRMIRDEIANGAFKAEEQYREQRRLQKWQTDKTALELETVKEKYSQKRRQFCRLCEQQYLAFNLPMTVSYKAIMDLRASWGQTKTYMEKQEEKDSLLSKPPRCYDTVRVCIFCAQFFDSPDGQEAYRPTEGNYKGKGFDEIGGNDLYTPAEDINMNSSRGLAGAGQLVTRTTT
jgi:hypothetical protein